jgi:hypothetical protein
MAGVHIVYPRSANLEAIQSRAGMFVSAEDRESCFGIYETSPCKSSFQLNREGKLEDASCEEFLKAIQDKEKTSGQSLVAISGGCC